MKNPYPSPEEVRSMLMGDGGEDPVSQLNDALVDQYDGEKVSGPRARGLDISTIIEEVDGVTFIDMPHTPKVYSGLRCETCGRMFDCICPKCKTCDAARRPC